MSTINFKYVSPTYRNCAPSAAQQQALASDTSWQNTLKSSYGQVFGQDSAMYNKLNAGLSAVANSINGFTAPELASMNAQTLNSAAANAAKVSAAIGTQAARGSATPGVESGIEQAERASANTQILGTAANEQAQITQKNAELGIQERDKALSEMSGLSNKVYSGSSGMAGEETQAENVTQQQANTNAQESRAWIGVVGGLADAAVGGLTRGLTGGGNPLAKAIGGGGAPGTGPGDAYDPGAASDAGPSWLAGPK
jgi:hypothetical protein